MTGRQYKFEMNGPQNDFEVDRFQYNSKMNGPPFNVVVTGAHLSMFTPGIVHS